MKLKRIQVELIVCLFYFLNAKYVQNCVYILTDRKCFFKKRAIKCLLVNKSSMFECLIKM